MMLTFLFCTGNTLFGQTWAKNSKLSVKTEIWFEDYFKSAVFHGEVNFFFFRPKISFSCKFCLNN